MSGEKRIITKLVTNGSRCGDGTEVSVESVGKHDTKLTCSRCGATRTVKIRHGKIDRIGLARLEEGVRRLHEGDA
jgi:hypothetical protein